MFDNVDFTLNSSNSILSMFNWFSYFNHRLPKYKYGIGNLSAKVIDVFIKQSNLEEIYEEFHFDSNDSENPSSKVNEPASLVRIFATKDKSSIYVLISDLIDEFSLNPDLGESSYFTLIIYSDTPQLSFLKKFKKYVLPPFNIRPKNASIIYVMIQTKQRITLKALDLKLKDFDVSHNYGDVFTKEKHPVILSKLKDNKSGLFLFHGPPGGGKTTYIKLLAKLVDDRDFIFVPSNMISAIMDPSFIETILESDSPVLILEDAEKAIQERGGMNDDLVSSILNLSDGLLSEAAGITLIITFNTQKSTIDSAIFRKGRLLLDHEFNALTMDESIRLAEQLKLDPNQVKAPMMLGDIYNLNEDNFFKEKKNQKIVGFKK